VQWKALADGAPRYRKHRRGPQAVGRCRSPTLGYMTACRCGDEACLRFYHDDQSCHGGRGSAEETDDRTDRAVSGSPYARACRQYRLLLDHPRRRRDSIAYRRCRPSAAVRAPSRVYRPSFVARMGEQKLTRWRTWSSATRATRQALEPANPESVEPQDRPRVNSTPPLGRGPVQRRRRKTAGYTDGYPALTRQGVVDDRSRDAGGARVTLRVEGR